MSTNIDQDVYVDATWLTSTTN